MIKGFKQKRKSASNASLKETADIKQYRCLEEYKLKNGGFDPKKNELATMSYDFDDWLQKFIELPIL
jgi:hypothetical protein